jgi:hypothetical protein
MSAKTKVTNKSAFPLIRDVVVGIFPTAILTAIDVIEILITKRTISFLTMSELTSEKGRQPWRSSFDVKHALDKQV